MAIGQGRSTCCCNEDCVTARWQVRSFIMILPKLGALSVGLWEETVGLFTKWLTFYQKWVLLFFVCFVEFCFQIFFKKKISIQTVALEKFYCLVLLKNCVKITWK
ncbi:UNVERIFIED_CONTAM: hypothetical protein K2H54_040514 [Gekko kuhli]